MGMFDDTHAWSITLSVVFIAFAIGMMAFVVLAPGTKISSYLIAQAITLVAAVAVHGYGIYNYEKERVAEHKRISKVEPNNCPDYWTSEFDACQDSVVCKPFFDTPEGSVPRVFMNPNSSDGTLVVKNKAAEGPSALCTMDNNRTYPWLEVTNACDARGRAV